MKYFIGWGSFYLRNPMFPNKLSQPQRGSLQLSSRHESRADSLCELVPEPTVEPLGMTGMRACWIAISHILATSAPTPLVRTLLFGGGLEGLTTFSPT